MSPFFCLTSSERKEYPNLFKGHIPEKYESTFDLKKLFYNGYRVSENTNLQELCERDVRIKESLKNFIESSVTDPELHPLKGKSRREIRNRYACSDSEYFDKIIDSLIKEGRITEIKGKLSPPEKLTTKVVREELLALILAHEDKEAYKVIKGWNKPNRWKEIGKEIIEEMKSTGSLKIEDGKLRPYFLVEKIFKLDYQDGKIKWSIKDNRRWVDWKSVINDIKVAVEGDVIPSKGEIDPSHIKTGKNILSFSFRYLVQKEERRTDQEEIVVEDREITVPPKIKVYQSFGVNEKILEMNTSPQALEDMEIRIFKVSDNSSVPLLDTEWIEKEETSYNRLVGRVEFFLKEDGKDLSGWIEERPLEDFFESFLEISVTGADEPGQNCECEVEADCLISDLFDKKLGEMINLHINGEKVGVEEKSTNCCLSTWMARRSKNQVKFGIDFKKKFLLLEKKTVRVPFPKPKIVKRPKKADFGKKFMVTVEDESELEDYEPHIEVKSKDIKLSIDEIERKKTKYSIALRPENVGKGKFWVIFEAEDHSEKSDAVEIAVKEPPSPTLPIKIKFEEYRYHAHKPVKVYVQADPEKVPEFIIEVDGNRQESHKPSDWSFVEFNLGRLPPGEHSVKAYSKKNPSISCQDSISIHPIFYCRVSDDFYDVTGGGLPELIVTIDDFSRLENFLEEDKNDDLYKQDLNRLFLQRMGEIFEFLFDESEELSSKEPYRQYKIRYKPSDQAKLDSGVYQIQWGKMGISKWRIKESKDKFAIGLNTEIISAPEIFIKNFDFDVVASGGKENIREIQNHLKQVQNPLRLKIRRKKPDPDPYVSGDLSDKHAMIQNIKMNHGPGKYEVILLVGNQEITKTEIDVLDFFLFPSEIPTGGTSYIQFMGPPESELPEIECNAEVGDKFISPYLTSYPITLEGVGKHKVEARWKGEKRNFTLQANDGDASDSCLNTIKQALHQTVLNGPGTSVVAVLPLKKLYFSPIRQWIDELLQEYDGITVGVLYWMIPKFADQVESIEEVLLAVESRGLLPLLVEKSSDKDLVQDARVYDCPECKLPLRGVVEEKQVCFECENGHRLDRIHFTLERIMDHPPNLLFVSQDFFEENICTGREYDVFLRERWGCPECNRVNPKYTRIVRLGGMEKVESILREVREELDEEIRPYKIAREYNRLWRRRRRIVADIKEQKRRGEELREDIHEYLKTFYQKREELALEVDILSKLSQEAHQLKKEQTRILGKIEEMKESAEQEFFLKRAVERFLTFLFPFYNGAPEDRKVRELLAQLDHLNETMTLFEDLRRSFRPEPEFKQIVDCWNEVTDLYSEEELVQDKITGLEKKLTDVEEKIKRKKDELESRWIEDPNEFIRGFWKKFSEKLEVKFASEGIGEKNRLEVDADLNDYEQIHPDSVKEFVQNVKKGNSRLIDRNLELNVHPKCSECGCEWKPIEKSPVLVFLKPEPHNLPDYLRCDRLDHDFVEEKLGSHIREMVVCRY